MGLELRVGWNDHKVVANYIGQQLGQEHPLGLDGLVLDIRRVQRQGEAIEAASSGGLRIMVDPLTNHIDFEGFPTSSLPYADTVGCRQGNFAERAAFVEHVLSSQPDASVLVAPYEHVHDFPSMEKAQSYMRLAREAAGRAAPVRVVLDLNRTFIVRNPSALTELKGALTAVDPAQIELRLSPLGGPSEGRTKVNSALGIMGELGQLGRPVWLAYAGQIGRSTSAAALAAGHVTGIGVLQRYDVAAKASDYRQRAKKDSSGYGGQPQVHIQPLGVSFPAEAAKELLNNRAFRSQLRCQIGECANSITSPVDRPREHFIHSMAARELELRQLPSPAWRLTDEADRLERAVDLAHTVNRTLSTEAVKTATLQNTLGALEAHQQGSQSAGRQAMP